MVGYSFSRLRSEVSACLWRDELVDAHMQPALRWLSGRGFFPVLRLLCAYHLTSIVFSANRFNYRQNMKVGREFMKSPWRITSIWISCTAHPQIWEAKPGSPSHHEYRNFKSYQRILYKFLKDQSLFSSIYSFPHRDFYGVSDDEGGAIFKSDEADVWSDPVDTHVIANEEYTVSGRYSIYTFMAKYLEKVTSMPAPPAAMNVVTAALAFKTLPAELVTKILESCWSFTTLHLWDEGTPSSTSYEK